MDSGNSGGSMQSSSGGDDDYDSRAESISAFFNGNNSISNNLTTSHVGVGPFSANHEGSPMMDPFSHYLDPNPRSHPNPSLLNLDMLWSNSRPPRSDNIPSFSSHPLLVPQATRGGGFPPSTTTTTLPPPAVSIDQTTSATTTTTTSRNPKKRSRASRRAPTTVLTTDTTNFRAMVQEFTGIPAPPFTSSSFPRTRLDLFGSSAPNSNSALRSNLDPPYLLRPFAQKLHPSLPLLPPHPSSSMPSSFNNTPTNSSLNLNNMQFNFQQKYPLLPHKSQGSLEIPPNRMAVLEDFGNVTGLHPHHHHNLVSISSSSVAAMTTTTTTTNTVSSSRGNGIVNYLASSSDFHHHADKGTTTADCTAPPPRTEGMVESWINCSSE